MLTSVIDTYEDAAVRWDISEHWEARLIGENSATIHPGHPRSAMARCKVRTAVSCAQCGISRPV